MTDFRIRMLTFLSGAHRDMEPATALTLLDPKIRHSEGDGDGDDKAQVRLRACVSQCLCRGLF